jgi:hypothetical protein
VIESLLAWRIREAEAFVETVGDAVAAEHERATAVNGRRLYLETMEQILPRIKKLIVDPSGNLDLTIIRKGSEPRNPQ